MYVNVYYISEDVRNKLAASTSDSLARRERERRKALCKITREDEADGISVVGGACLCYDPEVRTDGLPEKPVITNKEGKVDKEFILTWAQPEADSSDLSPSYRLEWREKFPTGFLEKQEHGSIVETYFNITGLKYESEYEVKLFAVNKQGESEPDVRTFKTKTAVTSYTTALKSSIADQTEFQPKLLSSFTIFGAKTEDIFTNLLIRQGRKTYNASSEMGGEFIRIPVKHCDEIFLGLSDDVENPNSILVVGKAGIGKSLFCQKLIRDWAKNRLFQSRENSPKRIPNLKFGYLLTFRQLSLLKDERKTLREVLNCSTVLSDNCIINDDIIEYILKYPKEVMIILDGYDEYSQKDKIPGNSEEGHPNDSREKMPVAALCSKLIQKKILKGAIILITSRPDEAEKLGVFKFERYVEIEGFSPEQVKEFIEKYFKKSERKKNIVLEHVMNNENLVSFAHVPMLCSLLCFDIDYILEELKPGLKLVGHLPVSMTEIYTKCLEIFELKHSVESEFRKKVITNDVEPRNITGKTLEKLSRLAADLLREKKATFYESEMKRDHFDSGVVEKLKGSGLLHCSQPFRTSSTTTTKLFSFTHLTVQEYLAARCFVNENNIPDSSFSEMVFQFMAGILSEKKNEKLMENLMEKVQASSSKNRLLAAKCLSECSDKEFAKKYIRKHPRVCSDSDNNWSLENVSNLDCFAVSFVLDIASDVHGEEAGHETSEKFESIKKLKITRSPLSIPGIKRICESLGKEHSRVSKLGITYCDLTNECIDVVCRLVSCKLTTLNLGYNQIADTNVASLCEALRDPSCRLTTLSLCANEITDAGFSSLCEVQKHPSCKLTTLFLGGNKITDAGVVSLCNALQHAHYGLTTLDLWGNQITDTSVANLCEALQPPSCRLYTLNLLGNGISREKMEYLERFFCTVRFQEEELHDLKMQTVNLYSE
ncbi:NACHT, LRR and PYD domains-containing protein 12-like [Stylophora pistillata]|uniref:NACHT, LRR and PYD domains-containing protein 12-like n=1 Tax=Stylophora pistillata TaxID=50429 RepID=UPI000C04A015|nr:NACHT, LRR and PYD domains-containing protein 12-like [Stylophora pistillata]